VVAGSAAAGAAALQSWPIVALGGVAYAALLAWDAINPAFWKKALAPEPLALPKPDQVSDPGARQAIVDLGAARAEIHRVLGDTPDEVKAHLGVVLATTRDLEASVVRLVERIEVLTAYLARVDAAALRRETERLEAKVAGTRDAEARAGYASALATRRQQIQAIDDIGAARERASAGLARVVATMAGLPASIVRMRALDAMAMDRLTGSMNDELVRIQDELGSFEDTLKNLVEMTSA
jgi:hypothetical protein